MSKKTKIISTIGPASNHPRIISNMIKKGTNVFRLNMAHLKKEQEVKNIIDMVRFESSKIGRYIAVMMDISGPKIRTDFSSLEDNKIHVKIKHSCELDK